MNKITKKVILNTTKNSLNDIADQLQIDLNKKTKKAIDRLATRFSILMKNEITKQTKRKVKSAKFVHQIKESKEHHSGSITSRPPKSRWTTEKVV
jgi:hypothetical protein